MCTLMIDGNPTLVAWTGQPAQRKARPSAKKRRTIKAKGETATPTQITDLWSARIFSGLRIPIRFDDRGREYKGTRYGCSKYNYGRKAHNHIKHVRSLKSELKHQIH